MPPERPPEPWNSFSSEIDRSVGEGIELQCLGGFVVTMGYGLARTGVCGFLAGFFISAIIPDFTRFKCTVSSPSG